MKKVLKSYFTFSRKERIAVIILLLIIGMFLLLPYFFSVKKVNKTVDKELAENLAAIQQQKPKEKSNNNNYTKDDNWKNTTTHESTGSNNIKGELFEFDPNTLSIDGWIRLGIKEKTAKTISNYISKGGKFKTPEDIRKIWGLRKEDADRIIPYARINNNKAGNGTYNKNQISGSIKPSIINANTATPQELKNIPGIGNSLPYKIVNYREKLGGFLNMAQVKETYGMTDSIFRSILPYLHVLPVEIRKLNINTATEYELNAHPYIDKTLAKAIVIYRTQHGNYKIVGDLKKIVFVTEEMFNKVANYLTVE